MLLEIYPVNRAPSSSLIDLLLRGSSGSGITMATPRNHTETWTYNFAVTSVVTIPTSELPDAGDINDGFTIRYI